MGLPLALATHAAQLAEHGGLPGVRDQGALESALARPMNLIGFSEEAPSLARLAAAYAYGIARNHPFSDGNKRAALVVSETFLRLNGYQANAPKENKLRIFLGLAEGSVSEDQLTSWFQEHIVPRREGPSITR